MSCDSGDVVYLLSDIKGLLVELVGLNIDGIKKIEKRHDANAKLTQEMLHYQLCKMQEALDEEA